MLRLTVDRLLGEIPPERILVVTSGSIADAIAEELPMLPAGQIIGEPFGRNSAPPIALVARWCYRNDPDAVFLVAPSDHLIETGPFIETLREAASHAASSSDLVTFGIRPTRPETGYGYIERGERLAGNVYRAQSFVEKPEREVAETLVAGGRHAWNSGMFVWGAATILAAFERHAPEISAAASALKIDAEGTISPAALEAFYGACPSISIDYAVMESATRVAVVDGRFRWSDVGSWASLGQVFDADNDGNIMVGDVKTLDAKDSIFYSDGAPIAAIGVERLIVVRVGELTLVCPIDRAQEVREFVRAIGGDVTSERHL